MPSLKGSLKDSLLYQTESIYLNEQFLISKKSLTIYNYDENGISSKYKKFTKNWWKKRSEAFEYMIFVSRKLNKKFYLGPDFIITKIINYFI